jgi:hypothetical protein
MATWSQTAIRRSSTAAANQAYRRLADPRPHRRVRELQAIRESGHQRPVVPRGARISGSSVSSPEKSRRLADPFYAWMSHVSTHVATSPEGHYPLQAAVGTSLISSPGPRWTPSPSGFVPTIGAVIVQSVPPAMRRRGTAPEALSAGMITV